MTIGLGVILMCKCKNILQRIECMLLKVEEPNEREEELTNGNFIALSLILSGIVVRSDVQLSSEYRYA